MTETNELQPTPEVEAAEVQETQAPQEETQAVETENQEEINVEQAPAEEPAAEEPAAEEPVAEEPVAEEPSETTYETKEQVVDRLKEIQEENTGGDKNELDLLKQVFYKLHRAAQLAARNAFIEQGGAPEDWRAEIDGAEENFKAIMASIRQRRAAIAEEVEKQKADNLEKKLAIIERIKEPKPN